MSRGDVWWVDLGEGRRPCVVLTRDAVIPYLARLLVVPLTTTVRGLPTEVALSSEDGVPRDCVANLDTTTLVPKRALAARVCGLGPARMTELCRALAISVDCA